MAIRLTGTDTNGVAADADSDTWITLEGQIVANGGDTFAFGEHVYVSYLVSGHVVSGGNDAITSGSSSSSLKVTITGTGVVQGNSDGIQLYGTYHRVSNNGEVYGSSGNAIAMFADYGKVDNFGLASGNTAGLYYTGFSGSIVNHGIARGQTGPGILVDGAANKVTNLGSVTGYDGINVINGSHRISNSGTITGLDDGIEMFGDSDDTITILNTGLIQTTGVGTHNFAIDGSYAVENITNEGQIIGELYLGGGDDVYRAMNGTLDGDIITDFGNDTVILGDGALAQRQVYYGGGDSDTLDLSAFSGAIWADLQHGNTQVWTRDGETLAASAGAWRKLMDLQSVENITGTEGVDLMRGDGSDNTFGYLGTALIEGIEQIDGRAGNDTMDFSRAGFAVWVDLNLVANHAYTQDDANATDAPTGANPWRKIANLASIENLIGTDRVDDLRGTGGDNSFGYRGDKPFAGVERIDGRGGSDTVDFSSLYYAVWVDLAAAGNEVWTQYDSDATDGGGNWAEIADLTSVENVTGSQRADLIRGDAGANRIEGGVGNDLLTGRAGADTFIFAGAFEDDTITDFDANNAEKIDLSGAAGIGTYIDLSVNHVSQNGAGDLVITDDNANTITLVSYDLGDMGNILGSDDFIF